MFEEIFTAPFTRQRHRNAALLQQRLAFLQSYREAGATRHTLRQMAERLLRLAVHAPEPSSEGINDAQLQRLVDSTWPSPLRVSYRRRIELEAKRWFEFLGWWRRPDITPMDPALARFIDWMRHERGLSDNTIASWTRWTGHFLRWCQSHGLTLDALQPQHLDNYLSTYQASGWNRRSVGFIVAMMRVFLRQAASRGECADTLAGSIFGPRVYSLEGIPASLSWDEVLQVLATANGSSEQDIRGVLLAAAADWRWLLDRSDSPWYPSVRLFRQRQLGNWHTVIHDVQTSLQNKNEVTTPPRRPTFNLTPDRLSVSTAMMIEF